MNIYEQHIYKKKYHLIKIQYKGTQKLSVVLGTKIILMNSH